jgi:hypothetical protein
MRDRTVADPLLLATAILVLAPGIESTGDIEFGPGLTPCSRMLRSPGNHLGDVSSIGIQALALPSRR